MNKKAKAGAPIDAALMSLEEVLTDAVANYPLLKQHMNIRVILETEKPAFNICLEQEAAYDLKQKAARINMSPETLITNLILEYLYDLDL